MSDHVENEIFALLGRIGAKVEEIERTVHRLARHHNIEKGDVPRTFHVKASKCDHAPKPRSGGNFGEFQENNAQQGNYDIQTDGFNKPSSKGSKHG